MRKALIFLTFVLLAALQAHLLGIFFPNFIRFLGPSFLQISFWGGFVSLCICVLEWIIGGFLFLYHEASGKTPSSFLFGKNAEGLIVPYIIHMKFYSLTFGLLVWGLGTSWLQLFVALVFALLIPTFTTRYILFER